MIETRVLEVDPLTGQTKLFHYDHATDDFHIETVDDITDVVEQNKALANEDTGRFGEFNRVASIPITLYFELKQKGIIDLQNDPKGVAFKRWLNDSDNRLFRTKHCYL